VPDASNNSFFIAMKPAVFLFIALGLVGVRAAPVPRTQSLTQNVCDDKLAIDCTLVRRGKEDGVSSQVGESAVATDKAKAKAKARADKAKTQRANLKVNDPVGYRVKQNRESRRVKYWRDNVETKEQKMKRLQTQNDRRAATAAHPIKGPELKRKQAASSQRWRDKRQHHLASIPPLVTDTNPADSSAQVAPHGARVAVWHPQVQHADAHSFSDRPLAQLTAGHGPSSSVTQAAHDHSAAINFWLSDDLDTVPHLTADDIKLFTS
jgi:hypothetical protein